MNEFIEKLIGRLEEYQENNTQCKSSDDYELGQFNACEYAIEIVNELAEEYNNDFCEWEQGERGIIPIKTKCGNSIDVNYSYEFCPYCGKKIKVVE